ncbi:MAG: type II toxin-antitoxin system prevent-host-death family antitoxin [Deltaproteobacteria bacterium]|nr:type II toxin-antitoxin system prevent-host-death family antitoxin [Deltaproteobacteria bacterium]
MGRSIGVRELKDHLSEVLRAVVAGERIEITDRNKAVAAIVPLYRSDPHESLLSLAQSGLVAWSGGVPRGLEDPPELAGSSVSDAVIEDRR